MFCHKCGSQIAEGSAFCQKCGSKVAYADTAQEPINAPMPDIKAQQVSTAEEDTQHTHSNDTAKANEGLRKAASIGRVLMWGSLFLLLLLSFWHLPVNPVIPAAGVPIGIILSALGTKRPWGLSKILEVAVAGILLVIIAASILSSGGAGDKYVQMVKGGTLNGYSQMTVGEAFDGFLSKPKWESGVSDDNVRFVNVTGGILYYEKDAELAVQFIVDEKNESFQYNACEINGIPQNNLVFWGLLETIYNGDSPSGGNSTSRGLDSQGDPGFMLDKIMIGETQSQDNDYGNIEVTLDYVAFADKLENTWIGGYKYPDEGCVFLWAEVTMKNVGTKNGRFLSWGAAVVFDGEYEFSDYTTEGDVMADLNPLTPPSTGALVFMVPISVMDPDKSLVLNFNDNAGEVVLSYVIHPGDNSTAPADDNASIGNAPASSSAMYATLVDYEDEESWVALYQDGTFDMQVNLYVGYGTLSGTYEETDWGFKFRVEERSFSGYEGDNVDEFEMVICDYGVEYRGDTIGTVMADVSVYQFIEP